MKRPIALYDKLNILMMRALGVNKLLQDNERYFAFNKKYQAERKLQLMETYADIMSEIVRLSTEAVQSKGAELQNKLQSII